MKEKEVIVKAPEGKVVSGVTYAYDSAIVNFEDEKKVLPKTWEEYCKLTRTSKDLRIGQESSSVINNYFRVFDDYTILHKLILIRDYYNDDWVPDWKDSSDKYLIYSHGDELTMGKSLHESTIFAFKSVDLQTEFYENFKSQLEEIKHLI